MPIAPALFTFDIFGTVLDWRSGLRESLLRRGATLGEGDFDRIVDRQGQLEQEPPFRTYREIVARSLADVLNLDPGDADAVGAEVGRWPAFRDSAPALARLARVAPCGAMTNSDRAHGLDVQRGFRFVFRHWQSAEEVGLYKPDPGVWHAMARRTGAALGPAWWHVSAYGDYDLGVARSLGVTTVLVGRPHRRPGPADLAVPDLLALAEVVEGFARRRARAPGGASPGRL
jgi:2-haloalkanoic acid dehalogenase type II